jgi:3,4-dihydroxy 2-butanone 4-phosphate synthase/GTP cyclohydrolase II
MIGQQLVPAGPVGEAARALVEGRPVLVAHGAYDQLMVDAFIAGALATPHWTAWLVRHTSGLLCATLTGHRADQLTLPAMDGEETSGDATSFAVAVDAAHGIGTGISATDRAHTVRVLADPSSVPDDLVRPGHVLPVRVADGGVVQRPRSAEATVDLCRIAGLAGVGLMAAVLGDDGELLRGDDIDVFARAHGLPIVHIDDIVHHRLYFGDGRRSRTQQTRSRMAYQAAHAIKAVDFDDQVTGGQHTVYLGAGPRKSSSRAYVVHECGHSDPLLGSDCACAAILEECRENLTAGGVIVYLRSGRGAADVHPAVATDDVMRGCVESMLAHLGLASSTEVTWSNRLDPAWRDRLPGLPDDRKPGHAPLTATA